MSSGRGFYLEKRWSKDRQGVEEFLKRTRLINRGIKIGVPTTAREPNGTSMALIAATHNFGSRDGRIPARPWATKGVMYQHERVAQLNRINLARMLKGEMPVETALGQMGNMVVGNVRQYIRSKPFVPLANTTLQARERKLSKVPMSLNAGNTTPLINNGAFIQSITFELSQKGVRPFGV